MRRLSILAALLPVALATGYFSLQASGGGPTTITVTAGSPSEYGFKLSKGNVPLGNIVFKVVNHGKLAHRFSIVGKTTSVIKPGKSASLTVAIPNAGTYPYFALVNGHPVAKGSLHVFDTGSPLPSTAPAPIQGAGEPTTKPADAPCTSPQATTLTVQLIDFGFLLSKTTVPCGTVTFNITNTGQAAHTFDIEAYASNGSKAFQGGKTLLGNESETHVITFTRTGTYTYKCDIHGDEFMMVGSLAVN